MRIFEWIFRNADETGPEIIPADFSNEELAAELDSVRQEVDKLTAEHAAELAAKDEKIAELAADCADKGNCTGRTRRSDFGAEGRGESRA